MASAALSQFHLFLQLPLEIRCQIWCLALPGPRIHRIGRPGSIDCVRIHRIGNRDTEVCRHVPLPATSSCWAPPLLLVCREAHDEVLHHMKRLYLPSHEGPCHSFASQRPQNTSVVLSRSDRADNPLAGTQPTVVCCKQTLVNPKLDTVYLPGQPYTPLALKEWLERKQDFSAVRSLGVDVGFSDRWATGADEGLTVAEIVRRLGHVKELCLISDYSADVLPHRGCWQGYKTNLFNEAEGDWEGGWGWVAPKQENLIWGLYDATEQKANAVKLKLEKERRDFSHGWETPEVVVRFVKYVRPLQLEMPTPTDPNGEREWRTTFYFETTSPPPPPRLFSAWWSKFHKFVTAREKERPQSWVGASVRVCAGKTPFPGG